MSDKLMEQLGYKIEQQIYCVLLCENFAKTP